MKNQPPPLTGVYMTKKRFDFCVLDSAPLLKGTISPDLAEAFYTVPAVVEEIRDEASRQRLANLPFKVETRLPSPEALALVTRFARSTGDFSVLSGTDLQVVALTVTLELEQNGELSRIRRDPDELPKTMVHDGQGSAAVVSNCFEGSSERRTRKPRGAIEVSDFSDDDGRPGGEDAAESLAAELEAKAVVQEEGNLEDSDGDGEGHWITPENIKSLSGEADKKKKRKKKKNKKASASSGDLTDATDIATSTDATTATSTTSTTNTATSTTTTATTTAAKVIGCVTDDFAMQNVLLRMRCKLYTPDGVRVKTIKNWLLRCHGCFAITHKLDTRFCPKCGGPTLNRVSFLLDESGKVHLFLRSDYQYNLRGTKYSLPMPKGGRQGAPLILREDQKEHIRQRQHYERVQNKLLRQAESAATFEEALDDRIAAVFGSAGSVGGKNRRYDHYDGLTLPVVGYGRRNPNVARKRV